MMEPVLLKIADCQAAASLKVNFAIDASLEL